MKYMLIGEESERLKFRELRKDDLDDWIEFCKHPDSLKYIWLSESDDPKVRCEVWFERVFARYDSDKGGMNILIDKATNKLVGQCGLLIHSVNEIEELEIGYSIMPEFRGMGFAKEAAKKCRDFAFDNNLRDSLISIINEENMESKGVALNIGMKVDFKTYYNNTNVDIFRITKEEHKRISKGSKL